MYERPLKDEYYIDIALAVSKRSTCLHRHYGAVIVKDDIIIATGYNGSPRGEVNCCDVGKCEREEYALAGNHGGYDYCNAVHAEQNALIAAKKSDLEGATLYLACECINENIADILYVEDFCPTPCNICRNMIKNSGIKRTVNRGGILCL